MAEQPKTSIFSAASNAAADEATKELAETAFSAPKLDIKEQHAKEVDQGLSHQLKYFLAKANISMEAQYKLLSFGVKTVQSFAMLEDSKKEVRALLKDAIGVTDHVDCGLMVGVWKNCLDYEEKESEAVATSHANGIFHTMSPIEHSQLRMAFEHRIGEKLTKEEIPSKAMLSSIMDHMHAGDPRPTPLDEVANQEEPEVVSETTHTDLQGYTRVVRKRVKGTKPRQQEEFRAKMTVEAHAWCMVAEKIPNVRWLKDISTKDLPADGRAKDKVSISKAQGQTGTRRERECGVYPPKGVHKEEHGTEYKSPS